MPPKTVWEWVEAYGAIHTDPEKVHGSWDEARKESALRLGELITEEAMESLYKDGGILLPDIRECETITLDLWIAVQKKKAQVKGNVFDEQKMELPAFVDFRMFSNVEWLNDGEIIWK